MQKTVKVFTYEADLADPIEHVVKLLTTRSATATRIEENYLPLKLREYMPHLPQNFTFTERNVLRAVTDNIIIRKDDNFFAGSMLPVKRVVFLLHDPRERNMFCVTAGYISQMDNARTCTVGRLLSKDDARETCGPPVADAFESLPCSVTDDPDVTTYGADVTLFHSTRQLVGESVTLPRLVEIGRVYLAWFTQPPADCRGRWLPLEASEHEDAMAQQYLLKAMSVSEQCIDTFAGNVGRLLRHCAAQNPYFVKNVIANNPIYKACITIDMLASGVEFEIRKIGQRSLAKRRLSRRDVPDDEREPELLRNALQVFSLFIRGPDRIRARERPQCSDQSVFANMLEDDT